MELDLKQLKYAVSLAEEKKGKDIILLNLKGISLVTDYFLLATGNSVIQVKAIASHFKEKLPEVGIPVLREEGLPEATWVLIDCGDLVVHVMTPETREFYNIERLWGDAEVMSL
ncbi:MAG: ribosome silencing factor [Desulfitobacteriaceae bacterium]|nr:ribosome silencing factor [Desulfitobacteriaceae bacterium]MDD4347201.1 ribosome silencing factor [Desulfitobacteriaceae bacterium]MDD4400387.1 ribosome silencing factor [Desulfitobacteriaceae bacterium]